MVCQVTVAAKTGVLPCIVFHVFLRACRKCVTLQKYFSYFTSYDFCNRCEGCLKYLSRFVNSSLAWCGEKHSMLRGIEEGGLMPTILPFAGKQKVRA